jgi:hypothetical protein
VSKEHICQVQYMNARVQHSLPYVLESSTSRNCSNISENIITYSGALVGALLGVTGALVMGALVGVTGTWLTLRLGV